MYLYQILEFYRDMTISQATTLLGLLILLTVSRDITTFSHLTSCATIVSYNFSHNISF